MDEIVAAGPPPGRSEARGRRALRRRRARGARAPFDFDDDLSHFKWALATAESYRAIGLQLWKQRAARRRCSSTSRAPTRPRTSSAICSARSELSGELAEQQATLRRRGRGDVPLRGRDRRRRTWRRWTTTRRCVVLSDHGFELGVLHEDPSKTRDMRRVSERFHRIEGILYLYGKRRARRAAAREADARRRRADGARARRRAAGARHAGPRARARGWTCPPS